MKKILSVLLVFLLIFSLSACNENPASSDSKSKAEESSLSEDSSGNEENPQSEEYEYTEKDAQNLIQWNLDLIYLGSISKEGEESFGMTSEDAEYEHIQTILNEAESFYILVGEDKYIEDAFEKCFYIMNDIYAQADYIIGEVKRIDDSHFEAEIDIKPILFTEYLSSELLNAAEEHPELEDPNISEEDFEKQFAEIIFGVFENFSNNVVYGDTVTLNVTVEQDSDGYWVINENDYNTLIETIIVS